MTEYLVLGDGAALPAKLSGRKPDLHLNDRAGLRSSLLG